MSHQQHAQTVDFEKERYIKEITQILRTLPYERVSLILKVLEAHQEAQGKTHDFQLYPTVAYTEATLATP